MPLEPPITEVYCQAVADCLRDIRQDNGYYTDLGLYVHLEDLTVPDDADGLCLVLFEGSAPAADPAVSNRNVRARDGIVAITVKLPFGLDEAKQVLHRMNADVERALDFQPRRFPMHTTAPVFESSAPAIERRDAAGSVLWTGWILRYRFTYTPARRPPAALPSPPPAS